MKLFMAVAIVLIIALGSVYLVTKGSPRPTTADIEVGLNQYLKYTPIKWDFKFGKETKTANGVPAWSVIYHITTSSAGTNEQNVTLILLFHKEGYEWVTEKKEN